MLYPESPNHPMQSYYLTKKGREYQAQIRHGCNTAAFRCAAYASIKPRHNITEKRILKMLQFAAQISCYALVRIIYFVSTNHFIDALWNYIFLRWQE